MVVYSSAPSSSSACADARDRRALLADGDVDALDLALRVAGGPVVLLVDDRVEATAVLPVCRSPMMSWRWPRPMAVIESMALMPVCRGSFTGWRCTTEGAWISSARRAVEVDLALAVDRVAQRVDHAAEEAVADGHGEDLARPLDGLALLDAPELAEHDGADLADVEVERQAQRAVLELEQLVGHRRGQALDARDAVTGLGDVPDLLAPGGVRLVRRDEALERVPDLLRPDGQLGHVRFPALLSSLLVSLVSR